MKYTEKLAKTVLVCGALILIGGLMWYFSNVVIYIAISAVVALIAKPLMHLMRKARIKKWSIPEGLMTLISMCLIFGLATFMFLKIFPVLGRTLTDVASLDLQSAAASVSTYMNGINSWAIEHIAGLDENFTVQGMILAGVQKLVSLDLVTSITGSLASFMMDFGIGLFSVIFISFFFIKDGDMVVHLVTEVVPDGLEQNAREAIHDIEYLLSRYFGGIVIEVLSITVLNFIGLHIIAGLSSDTSLTIAAITGIFNIIPYIGPWAGGFLGTIIGLMSRIIYATGGLGDWSVWGYIFLLVAIMAITHLIDVFLFQPFIYSSSIKANPLEIFIVILLAGTLGGPLGMLVAVPAYTVIRVIAMKFFGDKKAIKVLLE